MRFYCTIFSFAYLYIQYLNKQVIWHLPNVLNFNSGGSQPTKEPTKFWSKDLMEYICIYWKWKQRFLDLNYVTFSLQGTIMTQRSITIRFINHKCSILSHSISASVYFPTHPVKCLSWTFIYVTRNRAKVSLHFICKTNHTNKLHIKWFISSKIQNTAQLVKLCS